MKKEGAGIIGGIFKFLLMSYVITTIILVILAVLLWKANPPAAFISGGMIFAYIISCFVGGMLLGKRTRKNKYIWGLLFGLLYFAVLFAISYAFNMISGEPFGNALTVCMLCVGGGMLGGMLA